MTITKKISTSRASIALTKETNTKLKNFSKKYNLRIRDGDWLVRLHNKEIITMDDKTFNEVFEKDKR